MPSKGYHRIDKRIKRRLIKWIGILFSVLVALILIIFGLLFLTLGLGFDEYLRFMFDLTRDMGVVVLANVLNATVGG